MRKGSLPEGIHRRRDAGLGGFDWFGERSDLVLILVPRVVALAFRLSLLPLRRQIQRTRLGFGARTTFPVVRRMLACVATEILVNKSLFRDI